PFGGTSAHFIKSKTNKSGLVEILDVHEIESLVPFETIEKVLSDLNLLVKKQESLDFLKKYVQSMSRQNFILTIRKDLI
ncbi:TPA: hypothetical protein ACJJWN_004196, partial [Enterobacter asburiae]